MLSTINLKLRTQEKTCSVVIRVGHVEVFGDALSLRIDARICAFPNHSSKKNHHFGPIFWPIFDRFLTIFVKNFNQFCAREPAPQYCSIFDIVFFASMLIQILSSESHPQMRICASIRILPHHPHPHGHP